MDFTGNLFHWQNLLRKNRISIREKKQDKNKNIPGEEPAFWKSSAIYLNKSCLVITKRHLPAKSLLKKSVSRARNYLFYKEKAEFYEGFLNIVQRTVQYDKVTDCILTRTVWDRLFGTGTIRLITAGHVAAPAYGAYGISGGIALQYLEHSEQIYHKLQTLLHTT